MYEIYINDTLIQTTPYPCYVYFDEKIASFRTCDEANAEAVYVTEQKGEEQESYFADIDYIDYKQARHEGFEIARIVKVG